MNENALSDEEYVIFRTKAAHRVSADYAKSWMILAKTLFPRNFDVQVNSPRINFHVIAVVNVSSGCNCLTFCFFAISLL